jgi:hypothetical protein
MTPSSLIALRPRSHRAVLCAAGLVAVIASCDGTQEGRVPVHPVRGQVLYQGKPLADALVVLHKAGAQTPPSKDKAEIPRPTGRTGEDGQFRLHTYFGDDGAPEGEYQVAVSITPRPADTKNLLASAAAKENAKATPDVLGARYRDPAQSGLTAQIKQGENVLPPFELK